jgi:cardiolipin synthase A/B
MALEHHPLQLEQWARALEHLPEPRSLGGILDGLSSSVTGPLERAWKASGLSGLTVASALRAAMHTAQQAHNAEQVELVWTGPTATVPVRHTEQVLLEVIRAAKQRLFIVSFVAYEVESVVHALNSATRAGVTVSFLLESSQHHGGRLTVNAVAKMREVVPQASVFVWDASAKTIDTAGAGGSVHAKCAVADAHTAFVTSANLTAAALERNMEAGVLVRGGDLPERLDRLLHSLVNSRKIIAL